MGEIVAQICDAGTPGISDPGMELVKLCVDENIHVIPIPSPSAFVAALSASGLATDEFTFVGFLPKHAGSKKERLIVSAKEVAAHIFYVPPHKLHQFIEEASSIFGDCRQCAIAREMTKIHEEFWGGTLKEAKRAFLTCQPKGEITFLIEGKANCVVETPSESQLENELRELISRGQCLSSVKLEGDIDQGVEYYKKALYYNWHYANAMYNLGVAYGEMLKFDMGKMDVAASMIEKAIVANPIYAEAYNNLDKRKGTSVMSQVVHSYGPCSNHLRLERASAPPTVTEILTRDQSRVNSIQSRLRQNNLEKDSSSSSNFKFRSPPPSLRTRASQLAAPTTSSQSDSKPPKNT
ncbi:Ribosomal RNA small subunit methyltransferase I [Camellia lanceoleosa]|uniref:Ribosomal RNA small subunit methyltransferase I n=1 Tax=Camellia lanceoleosa TaxID=1840588 RepID=A0ACC0FH69_9ERIC|nr:Ribosomal RNA small subunit methyltransferase I [Camellia lanceoleosa]